MQIVYIDVETTGLDPAKCQVIQFGALIDDLSGPLDQCPTFEILIKYDRVQGEPYALWMNAALLKRIADGEGLYPNAVASRFNDFLAANQIDISKAITLGGKNVAMFDIPFLCTLPAINRNGLQCCGGKNYKFRHRVIDPGSMWALPTDLTTPDLKTCLERADIRGTDSIVKHTALADCLATAMVVRKHWGIN